MRKREKIKKTAVNLGSSSMNDHKEIEEHIIGSVKANVAGASYRPDCISCTQRRTVNYDTGCISLYISCVNSCNNTSHEVYWDYCPPSSK